MDSHVTDDPKKNVAADRLVRGGVSVWDGMPQRMGFTTHGAEGPEPPNRGAGAAAAATAQGWGQAARAN